MTKTNVTYDFQVVIANSPTELSALVAEYMNEGWKCQGGVHTYQDLYPRFCMAMTREPEPPNNPPKTPRKTTASASSSPSNKANADE